MNEQAGFNESGDNFHNAKLHLELLSKAINKVEESGVFVDLTRSAINDKNQYTLLKKIVDSLEKYKNSLTPDLKEEADGLLIRAKIYLAAFEDDPKVAERHRSVTLPPISRQKNKIGSVKTPESSLEKQKAIESIKSAMIYGVEIFEERRDEYVRSGVVTRDEINSLSDVKNGALESVKYTIALGAASFKERRDGWVKAGVLTLDEVNSLQYVIDRAIESIKYAIAYGVNDFTTRRDEWVEAGVVTREEINKLAYVKQRAIESLKSAMVYGMDSFKTRSEEWIKAGVITEAEADEILKNFSKS